MFTTKNKLKIIRDLKFSRTLKHLKTYLKKIDYLRQYVIYYTQKAITLQRKKTRFFVTFSTKNEFVNNFERILLKIFIFDEVDFFNQLQNFFNRIKFLIHYNKTRIFYIDVNVSKKREFDIIIYYVKIERSHVNNDTNFFMSLKRQNIESIMFLNKILFFIKERY